MQQGQCPRDLIDKLRTDEVLNSLASVVKI
jgi:hypothetical protein